MPSPVWDKAEGETKAAFEELTEALGERIARLDLPAAFSQAVDWHRTIIETDMTANLAAEYERGRDQLSGAMCDCLERGRRRAAFDYARAVDAIPKLNSLLDELFFEYEAFVTPAPAGLGANGSPIFCTIWTFCGMPAVTLPLLQSETGLPIGVQLVGKRGDDARRLRTARWPMNQSFG